MEFGEKITTTTNNSQGYDHNFCFFNVEFRAIFSAIRSHKNIHVNTFHMPMSSDVRQ